MLLGAAMHSTVQFRPCRSLHTPPIHPTAPVGQCRPTLQRCGPTTASVCRRSSVQTQCQRLCKGDGFFLRAKPAAHSCCGREDFAPPRRSQLPHVQHKGTPWGGTDAVLPSSSRTWDIRHYRAAPSLHPHQ